MATPLDCNAIAIEATVHEALGLTVDDLRLLPERAIADATGLLARHAGPLRAMALLDALRDGEESLTLADERTRLLLEAGHHDAAVAAARERLARKESLLARRNWRVLCSMRARSTRPHRWRLRCWPPRLRRSYPCTSPASWPWHAITRRKRALTSSTCYRCTRIARR